jgi:hypothetical protein
MSEQDDSFKSKANLEIRNLLSSPERILFTVFLAVAVIGWSTGIGALQLNEYKINREIARVIEAENEAENLRLATLDTAWSKFDRKGWYLTYTSGEYFYWKTNLKLVCKGSRECFEPIIISKFDCENVVFDWTFTKGDVVVSKGRSSKDFVSSFIPFSLYIESPSSKQSEFVNITSIRCNGKSY